MGRPHSLHAVGDALDCQHSRTRWTNDGAETSHYGAPGYRVVVTCGPLGRSDRRFSGEGAAGISVAVSADVLGGGELHESIETAAAVVGGADAVADGLTVDDRGAVGLGAARGDVRAAVSRAIDCAGAGWSDSAAAWTEDAAGEPVAGLALAASVDASWSTAWSAPAVRAAVPCGGGGGGAAVQFGGPRPRASFAGRHGA